MDSIIEDFFRKSEREHSNEIKFLSEHHSDVFQAIFRDLRNKNEVNSEELLYFPENYEISAYSFHALLNFTELFFSEKFGFTQFPEATYFLRYDDFILKFFVDNGHGVYSKIEWAQEEEILRNSVIPSFDDWLTFLSNERNKLKL